MDSRKAKAVDLASVWNDFDEITLGSESLPLAGFRQKNPSFFFGAEPPLQPPEVLLERVQRPLKQVGQGLPLLSRPNVQQTAPRWLQQIQSLKSKYGADIEQLEEVESGIQSGFKSCFKTGLRPPSAHFSNTYSFCMNKSVCKERLQVYEDLGALHWLSEADSRLRFEYVQPLHAVVHPTKKARVCVDLKRNFNDFIREQYFQFSSVGAAVDISLACPAAPYYVKLDISSCYLSFPVAPEDYKYFVCKIDGRYLQFTSLVFGHRDAPRQVSLALDVVSSALFEAGIAHTRYLDDFWIVAASAKRAWLSAHRAAHILIEFGLAVSPAKVEGPAQSLEYLGIVFDSVSETLRISKQRLADLRAELKATQAMRRMSITQIQSLVGKLNFAASVLPGARPFLRRLIDLSCGAARSRRRTITTAIRADLTYWQSQRLCTYIKETKRVSGG